MADGRHVGKYWKCYNSSSDGTDWDESWVVASNQHLSTAKLFRWYWSLLLTAQ